MRGVEEEIASDVDEAVANVDVEIEDARDHRERVDEITNEDFHAVEARQDRKVVLFAFT